MTEKDLQQAVRRLFHNHQYVLVNSFVFDWESDFFSMTKNGTAYEVEMKVTRADFRKDFEKEKHYLFKNAGYGLFHERDPKEREDGDYRAWYYDRATGKGAYYPHCKSIWHDPTRFFIPNKFFYACPPGVIPLQELPRYAGLIHVKDGEAEIIKAAPFMHKRDLMDSRLMKILLTKFWYLSQEMRFHLQYNNIEYKDCSDSPKKL